MTATAYRVTLTDFGFTVHKYRGRTFYRDTIMAGLAAMSSPMTIDGDYWQTINKHIGARFHRSLRREATMTSGHIT
jgi:hypothetical protein